MFACEGLPDRLQIVAGIEPFRNVADSLAERLTIAQERRAREHVDLCAGVVDVIFTRDVVTREMQQARQGIAEPRAAAMADMHRSCRIGRDIFDIDLCTASRLDAAIGLA